MEELRSTIALILTAFLASPAALAQEEVVEPESAEEPEVIEPEPVPTQPAPVKSKPSVEPIKDPSEAKTPEGKAFLEASRLPPRGTALNIALAIGEVRSAGLAIGGRLSLGWRLGRLIGLEFRMGAGGAKTRSGTRGFYTHGDAMLPIRFGICSQVPRVCPGLDLYIAVLPGVGYGYFSGNHAINGILGLSIESVRTRGKLDMGVLAAFFTYVDFLKDHRGEPGGDPWLSYYVLELGMIFRWGKKG